jgi:hypothetical protein
MSALISVELAPPECRLYTRWLSFAFRIVKDRYRSTARWAMSQ